MQTVDVEENYWILRYYELVDFNVARSTMSNSLEKNYLRKETN